MNLQPCYPFEWCTVQLTRQKMISLREVQYNFARLEARILEQELDEVEDRINACKNERDDMQERLDVLYGRLDRFK